MNGNRPPMLTQMLEHMIEQIKNEKALSGLISDANRERNQLDERHRHLMIEMDAICLAIPGFQQPYRDTHKTVFDFCEKRRRHHENVRQYAAEGVDG